MLEVLRFLSQELRKANVRWVLEGSLSLALQGVHTEPRDIDILTDRQGAFKTNEILKKYEEKQVEYSENDKLASYLGIFKINDVKVEVKGAYKEKEGDQWVKLSNRLEKPRIIEVDGFRVPVTPLEEQLVSYKRSTRRGDIEKIHEIQQKLKRYRFSN